MPNRVYLDPGVLVDRPFDEVVVLLNQLMAKTPVERLAHVVLKPESCQPPADSGRGLGFGDPFDESTRMSIRWQLGFRPPLGTFTNGDVEHGRGA